MIYCNELILGITCSIAGYVFIDVLTSVNENGIFDFYRGLMSNLILGENYKRSNIVILSKLYHVLVICSKCFAGQLALWSYIFSISDKTLQGGVICVCSAIIGVKLIEKVFRN